MYDGLLPIHRKLIYEYMKQSTHEACIFYDDDDLFASVDIIQFISRSVVLLLNTLCLLSKWKCKAVC